MKNNLLFYCLGIVAVFLILNYVKSQNNTKTDDYTSSTHSGTGGDF